MGSNYKPPPGAITKVGTDDDVHDFKVKTGHHNPKTRGNYAVNWCSRTKCLNRDKKCDVCFKWSEYA